MCCKEKLKQMCDVDMDYFEINMIVWTSGFGPRVKFKIMLIKKLF